MRVARRPIVILILLVITPALVRAEWRFVSAVTSVERDAAGVTLICGQARVRLAAVADGIARIRVAPNVAFGPDYSWAVTDLAAGARVDGLNEGDDRIEFRAGGLRFVIQRKPCRLSIFDRDQNMLVREESSRGIGWDVAATTQPTIDQPAPVRTWHELPAGAAVYGLGEKTGPLNKRERALTMWNTDRFYGPTTDPLYASIPFFIIARDGVFHGVFLDNPWRSSFDFDQEARNILSFGVEGGELNYYVIAGPTSKDVLRRYTDLTGRTELPPLWALGYQQCRYSYYPESRVREVARTFREKHIPCDVLYFDIDYMDGFRCFTWNRKWFPDPKKLMDDLHADGFRAVTIIDPGIKREPGYFVYDEGTKLRAWLTNPDGTPYVGRVWPGDSVFPDFTNPRVRDWWAGLFPPFIAACGVDGIWNDMNEPANFALPTHTVPLDLRFDNEGRPASHRAAHNVYGMQMHRATREGLLRARPGQRPFTLTRASYAGGQRFGAMWTGDNGSTWEHLRLSVTMTLGLGLSGWPFVGPDIGGFNGGATPELYSRWIQVGSLLPFCRTHTSWTSPDQEPWSFGPRVEEVARRSINRRYELLPYLYTLFDEASRTGTPIVRPLWMEQPEWRGGDEGGVFMLGRELLVMPTMQPEARDLVHWLPPGVWFDVSTGLIHAAGQPVPVSGALEHLPLYARAGAIIPMQSPIEFTGQRPSEPLVLNVWPFGESKGTLYEDDGATLAYRQGAYRRTSFRCRVEGDEITLAMLAPEGSYQPLARTPLVRLHGLRGRVESAAAAYGETLPGAPDALRDVDQRPSHDGNTWYVRMLPDDGRPQILQVRLSRRPAETKPVAFGFDDKANGLIYTSDMLPPRYEDGGVRLRLKNTWRPYVVLPRLRLSAAALPTLKLRLATESTRQLVLRFATEEFPTLSDSTSVRIDVTPGSPPRDYVVDLLKSSDGAWKGTVYFVRLDFGDGASSGEDVVLERVAFEPR